jgi:hypothetical protein
MAGVTGRRRPAAAQRAGERNRMPAAEAITSPRLCLLMLLVLAGPALAADTAARYWLYASYEGDRWCGYTGEARFNQDVDAQAAKSFVLATARVTYEDSRLTELRYTLAGESGDWELTDVLTPSGADWKVVRAYGEIHFHEVMEAVVHQGRRSPWQVTHSDGAWDGHFSYRSHRVLTPPAAPFMRVVTAMQARSSDFLCLKVKPR